MKRITLPCPTYILLFYLTVFSEPLGQHDLITENGYDDVEELPAPKFPTSAAEMSEVHFFPEN